MLVAVILGNRLNDDATISALMEKRLQTALKIARYFSPSKIILSGGLANEKAGKTEAQAMQEYLVAHGVEPSMLVLEDRSLTTVQNAQYSVPLALKLGATEILVSTSLEHLGRKYYNPIRLFAAELKNHKDVRLSAFGE